MMYSTCLMGQGSPTLLGMIDSLGCGLRLRSSGVYGEFSRTCFVYATSCSRVGGSMIDTLPASTCSGGSNGASRTTLFSGRSLGKLGGESKPLPLATNSRLPSLATAHGYQPTGTNPSTRDALAS